MERKGTHFAEQENNDNELFASEPTDAKSAERRDIEKQERHKQKNEQKLERIMKRKRRSSQRSRREELSDEDTPQSMREAPTSSPVKKRLILSLVIVLVLVLAVLLIWNSDMLSLSNLRNFVSYGIFNTDSDEGFPVDIRGENITSGNFIRMKSLLCYVSDTRYAVLNSYGRTEFSATSGYSSPVLVSGDELTLTYSLGGTGFSINSLSEAVYAGVAPDSIFLADIVDNGTYVLVTRDDGYNAKLYAYDAENEQIFSYSFADYYITAISLRSDGREAVVSGVSALNGGEISCVYVLDFTKAEPKVFEEFEGNIIYDVSYLGDSDACIIGSAASYGLHIRTAAFTATDYEGRTLTAYDINTDTDTYTIALSRSGDGRNCDLLSFSAGGTLTGTITTDERVSSLSTYKNRIAVLSNDTVILYSKDAGELSRTDTGIDAHAAVLYAASRVYLLGTNEITTLKL